MGSKNPFRQWIERIENIPEEEQDAVKTVCSIYKVTYDFLDIFELDEKDTLPLTKLILEVMNKIEINQDSESQVFKI